MSKYKKRKLKFLNFIIVILQIISLTSAGVLGTFQPTSEQAEVIVKEAGLSDWWANAAADLVAADNSIFGAPKVALAEAGSFQVADGVQLGSAGINDQAIAVTVMDLAETITATVDKLFSTDGITFTDTITVPQYRTVTERLYFNNTSQTAATGVTISTTVPAGFVLVPSSTKVCLEPAPGEPPVCNTDAGMGGPIIESAVWNGQTLTIAPTAGLYGESVGATSGRLEMGRKQYINLNECTYLNSGVGHFLQTTAYAGGFATGTNASNTATSSSCGGGGGGFGLVAQGVRPLPLAGRRYLNLHECNYLANTNANWINSNGTNGNPAYDAGTNTKNVADTAASCAPGGGLHFLSSSRIDAFDLRDNRYLNLHECVYYAPKPPGNGDFFASNVTASTMGAGTNIANTPDSTPICAPGAGVFSVLSGSTVRVLDLLDETRGTGYVEFQLRANAAPNVYGQTMTMDGNEFSQQQDSGTITVTPPPPITVDKTFSTDGKTFTDDTIILQGTTLTERLYYNNTDVIPATGATISTTVPVGFTLVPNTTKVCLEPAPGETVCNTDPGMGGAINESAVWTGRILNIAPNAGLYGEPVDASSGRLEVGRKRYINLNECAYFNYSLGHWLVRTVNDVLAFLTGTKASNSAELPDCAGGDGNYVARGRSIVNISLLGRRYLNLHECHYLAYVNANWINTNGHFDGNPAFFAGTNTSNSADASPSCAPGGWYHFLSSGRLAVFDMQDNRYLNLHECEYYAPRPPGNRDFLLVNTGGSALGAGTNIANTPDSAAVCSSGTFFHSVLWSKFVRALDLFDTTRGTGYIEFQVVANAAPGIYPQDVTSASNEFSDYTDTGNIDVRTLVDDDGDGIPNWVEGDGFVDTDGDGKPDSQDKDSDNDGIPDAVERGDNPNNPRDTDGDGIADYRDLDSDNDGLNDVVEAGGLTDADSDGQADGTDGNGDGMIDLPQNDPVDTDSDGVDDYIDLDSDNDTVSDLLEGGSGAIDADNDGVADGPDSDGDGIVDNADGDSGFGDANSPALPDKDSGSDDDNAPDYIDVDDDSNGGALDLDGAGNGFLDTNNDGRLDSNDTGAGVDADNDGIDDLVDEDDAVFGGLNNDKDGDGIDNSLDADDDGDGIPDGVEGNGTVDTDGDGIPDSKDLDSDNDGIYDVVEAGGLTDSNGDGRAEGVDGNNDGMIDTAQNTPLDTDGDSLPDFRALDSDGDGIPDNIEAQATLGYTPPSGSVDQDGVDTAYTVFPGALTPVDTDGDSLPDYRDLDSDNDGIDDATEVGNINAGATYTDVNGTLDFGVITLPDSDFDFEVDFRDADFDSADVTISKHVWPSNSVVVGTPIGYTVVVTNSSSVAAFNLVITDTLPLSLTGLSVSNSFGITNPVVTAGATVSWTIDSLAPGESGVIIITATAPTTPTTLVNTAEVTAINDLTTTNNSASVSLTIDPLPLTTPIKVILGGAYQSGSGLMRENLRTLADFPLTSPYGDGATISNRNVLTTGAIVDWVLVELRSSVISTTVVFTQAGLLQSDGDIVGVDGVSTLQMSGVADGNYYVAVRHRNHLGIMSAAPISVTASTALLDFTLPATPVYSVYARQISNVTGVAMLWPGETSQDHQVIAVGPGNDRNSLLQTVFSAPGNTNYAVNYIVPGYLMTDLNLDGTTLASGPNNDVNVILTTIFLYPNNSSMASNFIVMERLP